MVVGAILEDVKEHASSDKHASNNRDFFWNILYDNSSGTSMPEGDAINDSAHAGDFAPQAIVERGGNS